MFSSGARAINDRAALLGLEIAIPPFDRFTARDVRGPYEQMEKVAPA